MESKLESLTFAKDSAKGITVDDNRFEHGTCRKIIFKVWKPKEDDFELNVLMFQDNFCLEICCFVERCFLRSGTCLDRFCLCKESLSQNFKKDKHHSFGILNLDNVHLRPDEEDRLTLGFHPSSAEVVQK